MVQKTKEQNIKKTPAEPQTETSSAQNEQIYNGPDLEEVERAIRKFQIRRMSPGPASDTAWQDFFETMFAYLRQPAQYLHFSPLIRARVAIEFELDAEKRKSQKIPTDLEEAAFTLLKTIDYRMAQVRSIKGPRQLDKRTLAKIKSSGRIGWPLDCGLITSRFGRRKDPFQPEQHRFHNGIDLAAPPNEPVSAAASGVVTFAGWNRRAGNMVRIKHSNNEESVYAHLSTVLVKVDQEIGRGDVVGLLGRTGRATGHHLHFAFYINGEAVDPLDHLPAVPMSFSASSTHFGTAFGYGEWE
jgi:murein DD-endopeptidase MepM/ murein hydrolase activator NlpD